MCIGNLRTATQNISEYCFTKNKENARKGLLYFEIIGIFIIGAVNVVNLTKCKKNLVTYLG